MKNPYYKLEEVTSDALDYIKPTVLQLVIHESVDEKVKVHAYI